MKMNESADKSRRLSSKSGVVLRVRPLQPDDAHHLVSLFDHLGSESRYRRFLQPLENLDEERVWAEARHIVSGVPNDQGGLIAFADVPGETGTVAAVARYVRLGGGEAEIAMSVRDDLQGRGIGKVLLPLLVDQARRAGLTRLVGTVQNDNEPMWHLLGQLPYPVARRLDGTESEIAIDLTAVSEPVPEDGTTAR